MVDFNTPANGPEKHGDTVYDRIVLFGVDPNIRNASTPDELMVIQAAAACRIKAREQYQDPAFQFDKDLLKLSRQNPVLPANGRTVHDLTELTGEYITRLSLDELSQPATPIFVQEAQRFHTDIQLANTAFEAMRDFDPSVFFGNR